MGDSLTSCAFMTTGTSVFFFGRPSFLLPVEIYSYLNLGIYTRLTLDKGRDSSVGIATRYGLDGPRSNSGEGEIFGTRPDQPWGPSSLLYNGYRVFPGGKTAGAWH